MKYNLPCEIVEDLLPSYMDELTSEVSTEAVKEHLENCEKCQKVYKIMAGNEFAFDADEAMSEKAEIDFLKKNKSQGRKKIIGAALGTFAILLMIFGYGKFIAGSTLDPSLLNYELYVSEEDVTIMGNVLDGCQGVRSIDYTISDGTLNIEVKTTGASPIFKNSFESSYLPEEAFDEVTINGECIAWSDGNYISPKVSEIYHEKHSYIGDMSANDALANAIGLSELIGSYKNDLETSKAPYGWHVISDDEFSKSEAAVIEERIKTYAVIMLAMVDNLDYFEWDYLCDGKMQQMKMTLEDAEALTNGTNVKSYGASAGALQSLIEILPLHDYRFTSSNLGLSLGGDMTLNLDNETDTEIYGLGISFYVNGDSKSSCGMTNADGSALEKGDQGSMGIAAESEIRDADKDKIAIQFSVLDKDGNAYDTQLIELGSLNQMKEAYKDAYNEKSGLFTLNCRISGNYDEGFTASLE